MSAVTRRPQRTAGPLVALLVVVLAALALFFVIIPVGEAWAGRGYTWPDLQTTMSRLMAIATGKEAWTPEHTNAAAVLIGVPCGFAVLLVVALTFIKPKREEIDRAARFMGRGRQIAPLRKKEVKKKADRLGVTGAQYPGILLARAVTNGERLFASYEDTCVDIWGSRAGKSSTRAIPAILTAPGPVLCTSNKPDLVQVCAKVRQHAGRVDVFDPQGISVQGDPAVFFNPLAGIKEVEDAKDLARVFEQSTAEEGAKKDAFFSATGEQVVTDYLLAAGLSGQYITVVFEWINNPDVEEPAQILDRHGLATLAQRVRTNQQLTEKTRGGVYAEARRIVSFVESRRLVQWLVPGHGRQEFDPDSFVRGNNTLFLLSQEGAGSAGPVIAALTKAILNAAERLAATTSTGRLEIPLVAVLDEAANICRIRDLPDKYSHYGSKGILPMTLLQSYEQGVEVWGEYGMAKMWSAANVRIYGGNAVSDTFLSAVEKLVGTYEFKEPVTSQGREGKSVSYQVRSDSILSMADLAAVPGNRMIIIAGQARPTLARTIPWFKDRRLKRAVEAANTATSADTVPAAPSDLVMVGGDRNGRSDTQTY